MSRKKNPDSAQPYDINSVVKVVELDQALNSTGPHDISLFLDRLADPLAGVSSKALACIMTHVPMASLPVRWQQTMPDEIIEIKKIPDWIYRSCHGWGESGDFIDLCIEKLLTLPDYVVEDYVSKLALLQGCHNELPLRLTSNRQTALAAIYTEKAQQVYHRQYPKQICFSPTLSCQLNCSYCISAGILTDKKNTISLKSAIQLLDWANHHNVKRVCLSGGEPTLYPYFIDIIRYMHELKIEMILATNGLCDAEITEAIIGHKIASVTLHLSSGVLNTNHLLTFTENARRLLDADMNIALRINLISPDDDPTPYIDVGHKIGITDLRIAVPIPNLNRHNQYVNVDHLSKFSEAIITCVLEAGKRDMRVHLAKPFPLCMLPEKIAKSFLSNGSILSNCQVHMQENSHNLLVNPDLSFSPCLALNHPSNAYILDYDGVIDAAKTYAPEIKKLSQKPSLAECLHCPLSIGGRCIGICLSYRREKEMPFSGQDAI